MFGMPVASAARTMAFAITVGGECADLAVVGGAGPRAGGEGEDRVAVARRVHGRDRARVAIVGHHRHALRLHLGELGVGGDDADGGVLGGARRVGAAVAQEGARVEQFAVRAACTGNHLTGARIDDVAHRVHGDDGRDDETVGQRDGG
jgi:hypothetical protein